MERQAAAAIHAERVAGDDRAVRWVVPAGTLTPGRVRAAPGRLGEMLCDTTISGALSEHNAVWLWLRGGLSWSALGAQVQAALRDALDRPGDWVVDPAPGEVLERVTTDLLAGSVGDFVRSHGGSVSVRRAGEDVVVTLGGACEHCPAAGQTLRMRLMGELQRRCPQVTESGSRGGELTLTLR